MSMDTLHDRTEYLYLEQQLYDLPDVTIAVSHLAHSPTLEVGEERSDIIEFGRGKVGIIAFDDYERAVVAAAPVGIVIRDMRENTTLPYSYVNLDGYRVPFDPYNPPMLVQSWQNYVASNCKTNNIEYLSPLPPAPAETSRWRETTHTIGSFSVYPETVVDEPPQRREDPTVRLSYSPQAAAIASHFSDAYDVQIGPVPEYPVSNGAVVKLFDQALSPYGLDSSATLSPYTIDAFVAAFRSLTGELNRAIAHGSTTAAATQRDLSILKNRIEQGLNGASLDELYTVIDGPTIKALWFNQPLVEAEPRLT